MIFVARNKKILSILLILIHIFLSSSNVFADSKSLSVSPTINYFNRSENTVEKFELKIENASDESLRLKVYTAPYSVLNENFETSFEEKDRTQYNEITNWVSFKNDEGDYEKSFEFDMEKESTKYIKYKINFEESDKKEQYCVIFVEIIPKDTKAQQSTFRLATFVVAHDAEKEEKINTEAFNENGFKVKNQGENSSKISYNFEINSIFGKKVYEDTDEKVIFPESSRQFEFTWEEMPDFGFFIQKLSFESVKGLETKEKLIIKIPLTIKIIMVLLLTLIIFMLIIKIKNRKGCGNSSVQNKNN